MAPRPPSPLASGPVTRVSLVALAVPLLLAGLLVPSRSDAGDAVRYATSQQPHWKVGDLDRDLSDACRRNRFNQLSDRHLYISYLGQDGAGVTGVARKGWNLRDPDGRALPEATYHFADDGLSTCRVYVAKEKPPAKP